MDEESARLFRDWLGTMFWLSCDMRQAAELIRSAVVCSGADEPPGELPALDRTEAGAHLAFSHLQNARFASVIVAGWLDFDAPGENEMADLIRGALADDVLAGNQPEAWAITHEADHRWMGVQDRLREIQRRELSNLQPVVADLEADAARLESEAGRLTAAHDAFRDAYERVRRLRDEDENPEWMTAAALGADLGRKCREAAQPDRKSKRVRRTEIDGVAMYSLVDARRWWPYAVERVKPSKAR